MAGQALKPPFGYYGGKTTLAPKIAEMLPAHDHYVEPFAGSLAVLMAKPRSKRETVNDLDGDIMTFWKVLRDQPQDLERLARLTPHSRREQSDAVERLSKSGMPDIERARSVFVALTQGRANTLRPTGWQNEKAAKVGISRPMYLSKYADRIESCAERLAGVSLENRDAVEMVEDYGTEPSACIYADPPYLGSTRATGYRLEMLEDDLHVNLAEALRKCRASVVLSGYASPLYEELYEGWHRMELKAPTRLSGTAAPNEVLWSNVPLGQQASFNFEGITA